MKKLSLLAFTINAFFVTNVTAEHQTNSSVDGAGTALETIVVTSTREHKPLTKIAESVSVMDSIEIEQVSPTHPAELLNRMPGVHVNNLGGEGHMTAIRQPISTSGVYLFLEDGVPTRPSGFFNHNGLYEINVPQSGAVEVTRGPGSALYGSEAIGGIINVLTQPGSETQEYKLNLEGGSFGWKRGLIGLSGPVSGLDATYNLTVNATDNEGYRDHSSYDRTSVNGRYDQTLSSNLKMKVTVSHTAVNQSGASSLEFDDYQNAPETNYFLGNMGGREVDALRVTNEWQYEQGDDLITVTPFYRRNETSMMPSWMLTYDPNTRNSKFESYGLLAKYRKNLFSGKGEFIVGLDFDHTPSEQVEQQIAPICEFANQVVESCRTPNANFVDYTLTGRQNYNYDATQTATSPYVHFEMEVIDHLLLSAGLRYDHYEVDYTDNLSADVPEQVGRSTYLRPDSQTLTYDHLSPKLSALYNLENHTLYANYRHAFRAPSVGNLFRSGSSLNTTDLEPVEADNYELGIRSRLSDSVRLDVAIYQLKIKDDIVSYIEGNDRYVANAGSKTHEGVEVGLEADLTDEWFFHAAWSFTNQKYDDFSYIYQCFPPACVPPVRETRNFAGFDLPRAPEQIGNLALRYHPDAIAGLMAELEYEHLGAYYTSDDNTGRYNGHELVNLRVNYRVNDNIEVYGRVANIFDKTYSVYTSNQVGDPDLSYRPGLPRAFFAGVRLSY